eukprot:SAG31_NODE_2739_length_5158_cov_1.440206_1_plen_81_part_00
MPKKGGNKKGGKKAAAQLSKTQQQKQEKWKERQTKKALAQQRKNGKRYSQSELAQFRASLGKQVKHHKNISKHLKASQNI